MRLSSIDQLPPGVARPGYDRSRHGVGIVHLGLGAFFKAHQSVYTDDALAQGGGDWRILGVNLRSAAAGDQLNPQNGLYTVVERDGDGERARVVGALAGACALGPDRAVVMEALRAPLTRIVSLTVSEKGYGFDRARGGVDTAHPAIAADLATPAEPVGVAGLLVRALVDRAEAGVAPFTVLPCDNLPENGAMMRRLLSDFARRVVPQHADFIAEKVDYPATMVDRITPASTDETLARAEALIGCRDAAAVETEPFSQWVIEDRFGAGRPDWDAGGAILTDDARPYEAMKLRMLNGAHSLIAYAGFVAGHRYVRDVMADAALARLVRGHLSAAASTIVAPDGMDLGRYGDELAKRFANPAIAHETYQIAMDGSQKMPQRIFAPTVDALRLGVAVDTFAFAAAAWLRYLAGQTDAGERYALRDPLEVNLASEASSAEALMGGAASLPRVVPAALIEDCAWRQAVLRRLDVMLTRGMACAADMQLRGDF